jgi:hypothetical protein
MHQERVTTRTDGFRIAPPERHARMGSLLSTDKKVGRDQGIEQ